MTTQGNTQAAELPLVRVRRVMKADDCIRAVTQEAGVLVCKATELFLGALAEQGLAASAVGELTYDGVAEAVRNTSRLDFLRDIVPTKVLASSVVKLDDSKSTAFKLEAQIASAAAFFDEE